MQIKNITVENFQSYFASQSIDFGKGLNLIIGNGGKGKSKLFNAFYWTLFGKIYLSEIGWVSTDGLPSSSHGELKRYGFINERALSLANEGDTITASVSLIIEDDKGLEYIIVRSVNAIRLKGDDFHNSYSWEVLPNSLKISYDSLNGTIVRNGELAENVIASLFPSGIRNYIWFQGEALNSLINFRDKATLKAAVQHISYYPFYEKLSDIISLSKKKIEKQEKKSLSTANTQNQSVRMLLGQIDQLSTKIAEEEKKRDKIKSDIEIVELALAESEQKLSGLASYTDIVSQYKNCEIEITKLNDIIFGLDEYQRDKLTSLWVLRGIDDMIKSCKSIIEAHKDEEDSMPEKKYLDNPSRAKLEEILKTGVCFVCGSSTCEGTHAHDYIINRIKAQEEYLKEMEEFKANMQLNKQFNMFVGKIQDYPDSLLLSLSLIDKQWKGNEDNLEKHLALRKKKLDEKRELDIKIQEIEKKYGVNPVKQAETSKLLNNGMKVSRVERDNLKKRLELAEQTIRNLSRDLKIANDKFAEIGSSDTSTVTRVTETSWKEISSFLEGVCRNVQEKARVELLSKLEERANEYYTQFTSHDSGYKGKVTISQDYSIDFDPSLNTSHEDRKKLSIIYALLSLNQEALGTYYPFICDAPTSNMDYPTTQRYLMAMKDIFNQSIMITKDVVIGSEQYQELAKNPKVSHIYCLESQLYCPDIKEPDKHEVSTRVELLK